MQSTTKHKSAPATASLPIGEAIPLGCPGDLLRFKEVALVEKRCTKCQEVKAADCFSVDSRRPAGLQSHCRECEREKNKIWREKNKNKRKIAYYKNIDKNREKSREYHEKNKEKRNAQSLEYYYKNKEKRKAYAREYHKNNRDKSNAKKSRRRARLFQSDSHHTAEDIKAQFEFQGGLCNACGKKLTHYRKNIYHVDHIIPLSKGGGNGPENIQLLCPPCNLTKNNKDPIEWAWENGRLF